MLKINGLNIKNHEQCCLINVDSHIENQSIIHLMVIITKDPFEC